jgi:phosphoadenosine phosphosulfate reductase
MQTTIEFAVEELKEISDSFEDKTPQDVLRWAFDEFDPDITLACSFGAEDVVLVDMVARIHPAPRVFYLDTEFLFKETQAVIEEVIEKYGVRPVAYKSMITPEQQAAQYGENLYWREPNQCCYLRKVEPLERALAGLRAWITGIRRDQAPTRANAGIVELDQKFGLVKLNPLARWTADDVWGYIREHHVPYNVLHDRGYPSIGCWPCTQTVKPGEDPRAGRWRGFEKTECGLHK